MDYLSEINILLLSDATMFKNIISTRAMIRSVLTAQSNPCEFYCQPIQWRLTTDEIGNFEYPDPSGRRR